VAIIVAEYLGKRTDLDTKIIPIPHHVVEGKGIQFEERSLCPFNELPCKKMDKQSNARFPICSLRRNRELYIVCEHRLVSTSKQKGLPLAPYQSKMLVTLARELFLRELTIEQLMYKVEVTMSSGSRADYMLGVTSDVANTYGPRKLIVEMQGGGETSDTGNMTAHLVDWTFSANPTNTLLSSPISVGLIQTNAWRRLQEQILTKGSVAESSDYGFVACVSTHLFNLVKEKVNNFEGLEVVRESKWNTALVAYKEGEKPIIDGSIPLEIDRIVYMNYNALAKRLIDRGEADLDAFSGTWWKLTGEEVSENGAPIEAKTSSQTKNNFRERKKKYSALPPLNE